MHLRIWVTAIGVLGAICAALALSALLAWPTVGLQSADAALARVDLPGFAGTVSAISVRTPDGAQVPVTLRDNLLWPQRRLATGERLEVVLTVTRPSWAAWLVGRSVVRRFALTTPVARLVTTWIEPHIGAAVTLRFAASVRVVSLAGNPRRTLARPTRVVAVGRRARGIDRSGTIQVAAAPRSWETLPAPVTVSWFADSHGLQVLPSPAPSDRLRPDAPITLTFSQPVATVLGARLPRISPRAAGRWQRVGSHTLRLVPDDAVLGLGTHVTVTFPYALRLADSASSKRVRTLRWSVPLGTTLRLQQLLANLGYLPLRWQAEGPGVADSLGAQLHAALDTPSGHFTWRYPNTPGSLEALWSPGEMTEMTRAAVMSFEERAGMTVDGVDGPEVWHALIADILSDQQQASRYDYVYVSASEPETLHLWVDGKTIFSSPANTGIPAAPTALGSYAVYEHIPIGTMSGYNPNGTHYDDPGIRWISYFDAGEAIHYFPRASYGYPQSLGCVELPPSAAETVWPYTPIGTVVTIEA